MRKNKIMGFSLVFIFVGLMIIPLLDYYFDYFEAGAIWGVVYMLGLVMLDKYVKEAK